MDLTTRRHFLALVAASAAYPAEASDALPTLPAGRTGWLLVDTESGAVLDAQMPDEAFIPASTVKSITALLTLSAMPPTTRFPTRLYADGPIQNGVLNGDLHLVGSGDPALDTHDLWQLSEKLAQSGIRRVSGRFILHSEALPPMPVLNMQQPLQAGYNPSLSGLNLNFNRVLMKWRRSGGRTLVSGLAKADRKSVATTSVLFRTTPAPSMQHMTQEGREIWSVPARDVRKNGQRWFPVRYPASYAGTVLRTLCEERGITLPLPIAAEAPHKGALVATHNSEVVLAQLTKMMKYSNNLTAEVLGLTAMRELGHTPATLRQSAALTADWLRGQGGILPPDAASGLTLENYSGLSTASRLTPSQLVEILREGYRRFGSAYMTMHPEGEVRHGPNLPQYTLYSKTGTLHHVRALTGFIEMNRRRAAFAIFSTDDDARARIDASFTPYKDTRPPGARRWLRRALAIENALLVRWINDRLT